MMRGAWFNSMCTLLPLFLNIDAALAVELKALSYQKPMNDVIDRGDSDIQQLYHNTTVFITGGCGFIGKQLIEKLFRACRIKKMFVLVRAKKDKTIQERIEATLKSPVFDSLRKKQPNFADRIVPIEGNISCPAIGLSEEDRTLLAQEVNIIFHAAATIRFDEPLRHAVLTNVRGTWEVLQLAKKCTNLIKYVHISTAFTHATKENIKKDILEQFYPSPVPPMTIISLAEEVDEKRLNSIAKDFIDGWPNTYTFTKAIAEELVRTAAGDLPACIVRPPVVIPSYCEPSSGWLDFSTLASPSGVYLAIGMGVIKVFCVDGRNYLSMAPVDLVNNAIIASVWDSTERKNSGKTDIPIYTIAKRGYFEWNTLARMRYVCSDIYTPRAIWLAGIVETKHKWLYLLLAFFFHYVPAFVADIICIIIRKKPKEISSFVDVYKKIDKLSNLYFYFLTNEWNFRDDNIQAMIKRMSSADQAIFNCNMKDIDVNEYIRIWCIGLRKYILKDGLKNSAEGVKKQKMFGYCHIIFLTVYLYVLWWIFSTIFNTIAYTLVEICNIEDLNNN